MHDSENNDAPCTYIPEEIIYSSDSDSEKSYEPLRNKVNVRNSQSLLASTEHLA